jgi:hypothetical protein
MLIMKMDKLIKFIFLFCLICIITTRIDARIRYKVRTRPECRDKGPRRIDEMPQVVLTGFVEQLYPSDGDDTYSGSVMIKRVMRGQQSLENNRVTIGGFGTQGYCYSNVRKRDTWIFLLNQVSDGSFKLNSTLLKVTLPNLDRINAIIKGRYSPLIITSIKYN